MKAALFWRFSHWEVLLPFTTGPSTTVRTALELRLECQRGSACSEAAPLPGLHAEKVEDLPGLLPSALHALDGVEEGADELGTLRSLEENLRLREVPPSLRWAMGWAWSEASGLVQAPPEGAPPTAALLARAPGQWVDEWQAAGAAACVKVKVGRGSRAEEIAGLRALRLAAPALELRLDANAAWSLEEALAFEAAGRELEPAFVEEPLRAVEELTRWRQHSVWPLALDEHLGHPALQASWQQEVVAWVLKPQVLGLVAVLERIKQVAELGSGAPRVIISSSFESPLGLRALRCLAALAPGRPAPGLGTERWFSGRVRRDAWRLVERP